VGTDKRDRQKSNRANRLAEAEEQQRKQRTRSRVMTYGILALVVAVGIAGVAWLASDDDDDSATDAAGEGTEPVEPTDTTPLEFPEADFVYGDGECPPEDGVDEPMLTFDGPPPLCIDPAQSHVAVFATSEGEIRVDLDGDATPGTVNNFVTLARWGYYDGTTIHRTDPSIDIIQGGSPTTESAADPGPGYTITDEPTFVTDPTTGQLVGPYRYEPGQLVMARAAGPDSASGQYFFSTGPNTNLLDSQGVYVVFGQTDEAGLGVLETIIGLHEDDPTTGLGGAPSETVTIESVTIEVS